MLTVEKQYVEWTESKNGSDTLHNNTLHNNTLHNNTLHSNALHKARWLSSSDQAAPAHIEVIDDSTSADKAYRLACAGTSLLYRGDFHNARQLLQAMTRRVERSEQRKNDKAASKSNHTINNPADDASLSAKVIPNLFHQQRQAQAQRSRILGRLLLELDANYISQLRRAPDVSSACTAAFGEMNEICLLSLRDLQGALGSAQWREKGVPIASLGLSIYPHYGVFAPTRHEYVQLLLDAPLPANCNITYDIGTGTGLLAIILAQRGVQNVIATDLNPQAIACAQDNFTRQELSNIQLQQADMFPIDAPLANLIICNPPWLPAKPTSPLEYAVYDEKSKMLRGFLQGTKQHLAEQGELWLIMSDLAEHLQLRSRDELLDWIANAGLTIKYRLDTQPKHGRSQDETDPLYAARSSEITSLWCLVGASDEP
ncbi:class I SAM-dependent methyltransferase [Psychrobacter sp. M13]|uniref:class I SAM-dependent methyltransferase n=1 Tax=Psychrobacter sp. M13 TaxID=3067275 RepID=UPI00273C4010|nr:class I SAM-dependent methyltransferase [Psychrobacter sp. M13]WLP94609.1 class I SAM-dependent methyltransferase [Psychrobacter sp. M13]